MDDEEKIRLTMTSNTQTIDMNGKEEAGNIRLQIARSAYTQQQLDSKYRLHPDGQHLKRELQSTIKSYHQSCTLNKVLLSIMGLFPFINQLRTYKPKEYLQGDLLAGFIVAIIHIPQSMGFALLTSVQPVYGLYTSFWHVLVYFLFGASPHVSLGSMALISLMIGEVVDAKTKIYQEINYMNNVSLTEYNINEYQIGVAVSVSLLVGCIQILMAVLQLGIVTSLMSTSLVVGFTMGAAIHIVTSQCKALLGVSINGATGIGKAPKTWIQICEKIPDANVPTIIISIISLLVLIIIKEVINERYKSKLKIQIPIDLLVVILGTVISYVADLPNRYTIKIVGEVSLGFPTPIIPDMSDMDYYLVDGIVIAIISFVITYSMTDTFARKHGYDVNINQELFAQGMCNALPSFMSCFAGAAAPPRCALLSTQGSRTQLSSICTCAVLLLVIMVIGPYFKYLPTSVLACIIIVALFPIFKQFDQAKQFWKINKPDFAIWLVTLLSVTFLSIDVGLVIGVGFSVFVLILNNCFIKGMEMNYADDIDLHYSTASYKKITAHKRIKVFKFESDLYFAMKQVFKKQLFSVTKDPNQLKQDNINNDTNSNQCYQILIIDCSCISYIDIVGIHLLTQLHADYKDAGITLVLAACPESMIQKLYHAEIIKNDDTGIPTYPTVQDAISLS